ncbi:siroheme decarboxylase subunit beta [Halocatena pleomorpha]|uniref:siroheme decarboxylase n=1 Tax=Halocatena pleomorpha TaxID=1785090 RepID=A0A3P3R2S3_9EURY|nr:Lrp/AsnC family transcriptional regulator [Halocatena pleomorpha]RRJ27767.1 Lrp/AsnC family transcriptional regulator [Halocatena pleomorpha]
MSTEELDRTDRAIINGFQGGFPVTARPFEAAADALSDRSIDVTAEELITRIRTLSEEGVLTRFGPLINAEAIGGTATLVAMHAPEDQFEAITEQVNDHREVAHNYEREHPHLNMWFVVSVADADRVEQVLDTIESETGQPTYNMPKQREFRVEAKFPIDGPLRETGLDLSGLGPSPDLSTEQTGLTTDERALLREIQDGLPLTQTPYADVGSAIDQPLEWVLETIAGFNEQGQIRRIGVIPNHYALGYTENGMTVWNVPDDLIETVGPAIASLEYVTHCYERPRHEDVWPYNFFAMTHGRTEAESDRRIRAVRDRMAEFWAVDADQWDTLFSTTVLKKTGIRLDDRLSNTEST